MTKIVLITGSTDGIGFETAKMLLNKGQRVLLHGRDPEKLTRVENTLRDETKSERIESYIADLSDVSAVKSLAEEISRNHKKLDILINNAGVYSAVGKTNTDDGLDVRFVVNAIAPYFLTQLLLPMLEPDGRVINVSSAAQATVDLDALAGKIQLADGAAYAQSKLALTMWSRVMGLSLKEGPVVVAVNPKSMLGSKMVKAFGVVGGDLRLGADILVRASLSEEFANATGQYFDNDIERFADPHPDALDPQKCQTVVDEIEKLLAKMTK